MFRGVEILSFEVFRVTWRFMGSYKWGYTSPNMGYTYSYPTYNPTYNYP